MCRDKDGSFTTEFIINITSNTYPNDATYFLNTFTTFTYNFVSPKVLKSHKIIPALKLSCSIDGGKFTKRKRKGEELNM